MDKKFVNDCKNELLLKQPEDARLMGREGKRVGRHRRKGVFLAPAACVGEGRVVGRRGTEK